MFKISHYQSCFWLVCLAGLLSISSPIYAQLGQNLGDGGFSLGGLGEEQVSLDAQVQMRFVPETAVAGEEITAEISIKVNEKGYIYSQNPNIGAETRIQISETLGLAPVETKFFPNKKPKVVVEPLFNDAKLEKFYGGVTWTRKYRVTGDQAPQLKGTLSFQVCDDASCNPYNKEIQLSAPLGASKPKTPTLKMLLEEAVPTTTTEKTSSPVAVPTPQKVTAQKQTLPVIAGKVLAAQEIRPRRSVGNRDDPITFNIALKTVAEDKNTVVLSISAKIDGAWHLYAQTQDPEMIGLPTILKIDEIAGLTPIDAGFLPDHAPEITQPFEDVEQQIFHNQVTWQRRYRLASEGDWGNIAGSIRYQLCEANGSCLPPNTIPFALNAAGQTGETAATATGAEPIEERLLPHEQGLIPFLLTGIAFGYMALLTPCVFPMVPITVSFFLKQSEKEHHNPVGMALLYCIGIVATFTVIGILVSAVFGAAGMNMLANNTWFNVALAGVLVFFGLNMLGLFDIRVPSWLLTWSSSKERQGGVFGVLFMAFTFTLVSFTCTFAFVGLLLPMAAQGNYYWPALGMMAFSAAFASPFFFLALFPSYLKKLPKSGGWMNNIKVVFGLLELGAAFKFLSVADINWFSAPYLFDYALVMTAWMVIGIVTGLYLLGLFKLPHDTPSDHIGVIRLSFALLFFSFSAYLASGIYGNQKPEGAVWQQIAAFAPPSFESKQDTELGPALEHDELLYALDVDQAIKHAAAQNLPLFFDFTGTNCVNCRFMEVNIFPKPENRKLLSEFIRVQIYTDSIPEMKDQEQLKTLLEKNRQLQSDWFNDATLPAYAIVSPDGKKILSRYKGAERSQGQFTRFLQAGLEEWQRTKTALVTQTVRR